MVAAAKRVAARPLIVKLSPNVGAIEPLARAAEASGADALSLVNTFISLAIDARTRRPRIGAGFGGLSGPAIKPIALRLVYQAARAVKIPVIGLGGIASGEDAAEFLIAGASAVEVGTATFWDPRSPLADRRGTVRVSAPGKDRAGRRSGGHAKNVTVVISPRSRYYAAVAEDRRPCCVPAGRSRRARVAPCPGPVNSACGA